MKLYYLASYYQLLMGIVHNQKNKTTDKVVFVVDNFLMSTCESIDQIVTEGFADELYSLPFIAIKENSLAWVISEAEKQLLEFPYKLQEFDEIFVAASHSWFGIYLASKKIEFSMFEECCGILSKVFKLRENVEKTSKKQDIYAEQLGLYSGNSESIKEIICSSNNDESILNNKKVIIFDLVKEINELQEDQINTLVNLFASNIHISSHDKGVLLLTQHFANLGILEWDEQQEVYRMMVDYFCDVKDKVYVKTHPADIMNYENVFEDCYVIKDKIPSELLPFVFNPLPNTIMTLSSTAIDGIGGLFKNSIVFDFEYEQWFPVTHNYFCALQQVQNYVDNGYSMFGFGVNQKLLSNLNEFSLKNSKMICYLDCFKQIEEIDRKAVVFIDDFLNDDLNIENIINYDFKDVIFIYLNSKFQFNVCRKEIIESMKSFIPVEVFIEDQNETILNGKYYMFSKGEIEKMVEVKKKLKYENSIVYTSMFEDDEMKIKILEGILRATEERLLFYIEKERD